MAEATYEEAELALREDETAGARRMDVLQARKACADFVARSGLLTSRGDSTFAFYHLSIQEFLAAESIFERRRREVPAMFIERSPDASWRNTLTFLFARYMPGP